ncbi:MAG: hypothetical protein K2J76_06040 [Oscillospiraceae bacterium]|nr:hypothetical protein [Oscillospiraceae bacterium]
MKFFKKIAAAVSSALLVAALCTSVSAENVIGFDYAPAGDNFKYYDFTAEDGAEGTLVYTADNDGNLYFSSYKIDAPAPESPEDFPNYTDPDGGYKEFTDDSEFFNYLDELSEKDGKNLNYVGIVSKFDVSFNPILSDGTFSMYGGKCYIADIEAMTVSYVGYYAEFMDSPSYNCVIWYNEKYCECTAEDGSKITIMFNALDNGGLEYVGCEISAAPIDDYAYSTDSDTSQIIISSVTVGEIDTGYTLYSDPDMIPLAVNEVLAEAEVECYVDDGSEFPPAVIEMKKYFVITLNGMNSTARYAGSSYEVMAIAPEFWQPDPASDFLDGETTSPKTGNGGGYMNIMLAAAGLAVIAKLAKK